jgi:small subunit ribosomal protein S21
VGIIIEPKYTSEPFEKLLRRFKNAVKSENIIEDIKKNEYYEKPSIKKRKKSLAARRFK